MCICVRMCPHIIHNKYDILLHAVSPKAAQNVGTPGVMAVMPNQLSSAGYAGVC